MQSVYGLKVTLYYTTNPFICKYFFQPRKLSLLFFVTFPASAAKSLGVTL